jgi:hypothetical protein
MFVNIGILKRAIRAGSRVLPRATVPVSLILAIAAVALPRDLTSQVARKRISVQVTDSAGMPIPEVIVDALAESDSTLATGRTDSMGIVELSFAHNRVRLTIRARKLGYQPNARTFDVAASKPARLTLILSRSIQQLGTVQTTESPTLLRQRYHIDADAIGASRALLIDGFDIIAKLRPDIAWGRGNCGGAANIWVNGRWIPPELLLQNDIANARAKSGGASSKVSRAVLYALTMIPPEDIAEMTYLDCRDTSLDGLHTQNALFVVLKGGLQFDPGSGVKQKRQ